MLHTRFAALALILTTFAASGCGGSKTTSSASKTTSPAYQTASTSAPTGPLTHAEAIARTNAICARLLAKLEASVVRTSQDFLRIMPQLASYERSVAAELRRLTPPASLVHSWRQVILSIETLADNTVKGIRYAKSGNTKAGKALLLSNVKTRKPMLEAAGRAGFTQCAQVF
jgi:hypothetical protein